MTVDEAIELVRRKWDQEGDCASCGWHACLYEYEIAYGSLAEAIEINEKLRRVEMSCLNSEDDGDHRGVRIYFDVTVAPE